MMAHSMTVERVFLVSTLLIVGACAREPCQRLSAARPSTSDLDDIDANLDPTPRCQPSAPDCGPQPRRASESCYRPSAQRERLPTRRDDEQALMGRGGCSHDGECNIVGCGNVCANYRVGNPVTNCKGYDWLDDAEFCGCVEGECAFFRQ